MTTQIKRRRGTTAEHASFTGAEGELTIDTTKDTVVVHDGSTAGGHPLLKESGGNVTGNIAFGDNDKAIFGAGSDLQIYSDGNTSFIKESGAGNFAIDGTNIFVRNGAGTANMASFVDGGAAALYHNSTARLATTSTGVDVTGTVTADGLTVDGLSTLNGRINIGGSTASLVTSSADPQVFRTTTGGGYAFGDLVIQGRSDSTGRSVYIAAGATPANRVKVADNGDISFYEDTGTTPKFFWDASAESLGIGTSSPDSALHIASETNGTNTFTMESLDAFLSSTQEANAIHFQTNDGSATGVTGKISQISENGNEDLALAFSTYNGTLSEAMRIDSSGRVGIGTTSPVYALQIGDHASTTQASLALASTTSGTCNIRFGDGTGGTNASRGRIEYAHASDSLAFWTTTSERMRIDSSGNVGIGTSSPSEGIHLARSNATALIESTDGTQATLDLKNTEGHFIIGNDGGSLFVFDQTDTTERMRIDSSGNVGIGEVSPSSYGKLTVLDGATRFWIKQDTSNEMMLSVGASERMLFGINNSEAMRIDSSGNLLVGTTSNPVTLATTGSVKGFGYDAALGFAVVSRASDSPLIVNRLTDDGSIISMRKNGTVVGSIASDGGIIRFAGSGGAGSGVFIADGGVNKFGFATGENAWRPASDNTLDLGTSVRRYDDIYATNGTIQTSDANEKQQIASLTTAEMQAAKAISGLFKTFKWNDSVAEKGADAARTHSGVIAQEVEQAMTDAGLDAGDYAFFISSTWWETQTDVPAVAAVAEVLDDDGNVVTEAVEAKDAYTRTDTYDTAEEAPEGATERTRKGIRYPQLLSFVGAATEQRLADIETRLTALEGA